MGTAIEQYPDFTGLTFEKVWAMFKETDKKFQETTLQAGFYVILQGGDTITIDIPDGFEPLAF